MGNKLLWRLFQSLSFKEIQRRRYLFVFMFALSLRVLYVMIIGRGILASDSYQYLTIARNLIDHGAFSLDDMPPFGPTIRRAPVYPAFLALLHLLGARAPFQIAIAQALLGALCCPLVFYLAKQVMSERRAALAACFYAVFPAGLLWVPYVLSETLFTLLLLSSVALTVAGIRRGSATIIAGAGAMLSLSAMCRPISLPLVAIFAAILALRQPRRLAAFFVLASACAIAPWAIRTSYVSHSFTPIQGYGAVNVHWASQWWIDQKDYASVTRGFERSPYGLALKAAKDLAEDASADRLGMKVAMRNIMADPKAYLLSRLKSYPYLFISGFGAPSFGELWARRCYALLSVKLLLLLMFSIAPLALAFLNLRRVRENSAMALCAAVWIYTLVAHLPLWIESRFWAPAFPFLAVCAFAIQIAPTVPMKSNW
jgi:4-amino-4-deoxy-L-arabinose transferase-like glycosyltransferase